MKSKTHVIDGVKYNLYELPFISAIGIERHGDFVAALKESGINYRQFSFFHVILVPVGEQSMYFELKFGELCE